MTDTLTYCDQCGEPAASVEAPEVADTAVHARCAARRELEPPRYCGQCKRRMVVQVVPRGWTARCSEHGTIRSEDR
jgi:hypothetical protein